MHTEKSLAMDVSDTFRQAPDVTKADFFDFVTSPDFSDAQFKQQMKSVNIYMETDDTGSNPLLSDAPKEQNNNVVQTTGAPPTSATTTLQSFDSIWNVDRDRDRLENSILEDLNKFYWSQEGDFAGSQIPLNEPATSNKLISNNTDGHIYTLTVLNGEPVDANASRYWQKEEEVSISSPSTMEQIQQSNLDLESILNIIPNQMNGFSNGFGSDDLASDVVIKTENFSYDEPNFEEVKDDTTNTYDGIIKEEITESLSLDQIEVPVEFNDNNNDWKLTNQNSEANDSLLRSALQGKTFVRYTNGAPKIKSDTTNQQLDKRLPKNVIYKDDQLVLTQDDNPQGVNIVLFEDPTSTIMQENENPSTAHSVVDILLSQLNATYTDDYEKLKRISNEVAESVQQFCTVETVDPSIYNIHHLNGTELVTMIPEAHSSQNHIQIVTASPTVSSTKSVSKKYKRVQNRTTTITNPTLLATSGSNIQTATSTSNGIRKERSLHYCSICSKGFKDKYSVNVHIRTHTGEKPFACSLCGKSFRQKAHLAKHYQTHIAQKNAAANGTTKTVKQR